jgi:hypothetical protein
MALSTLQELRPFRRSPNGSTLSSIFPQELSPEQEESLLGTIKRGTLGGVTALGNFLDIPGSFLRDIVAGENPLDQVVSPFTSENRVTSRDLLSKWGLLSKNKEGFDWEDIPALGFDILTDPLTYLTFGGSALSKAGQLAKKAGMLDDVLRFGPKSQSGLDLTSAAGRRSSTLRQAYDKLDPSIPAEAATRKRLEDLAGGGTQLSKHLDQFIGGRVGVGLPFREPAFTVGGQGGLLDSIMDLPGKGVKKVAEFPGRLPFVGKPIREFTEGTLKPVGRALRAQFDKRVEGAKTVRGQQFGQRLHQRTGEVQQQVRDAGATAIKQIQDAGLADKTNEDLIRSSMEGWGVPPAQLGQFLQEHRTQANKLLSGAKQRAMKGEALSDFIPVRDPYTGMVRAMQGSDYAGRSKTMVAGKGGSARVHSGKDRYFQAREDVLKGVFGGTESLKKIFADPAVMAEKNRTGSTIKSLTQAVAASAARNGGQVMDSYYKSLPKGQFKLVKKGRYGGLAQIVRETDDEILKQGLYGNHPLVDMQHRFLSGFERQAAVDTADEFLTESLEEALKGQRPTGMVDGITVREILEKLDRKPKAAAALLANRLSAKFGRQVNPKDLLSVSIDRAEGEDVLRFFDAFKNPESMKPILDFHDSILNFTKASMTGWRPAFHTRNLVSGAFNNFVAGLFSPTSYRMAWSILHGREAKGASSIPAVREALTQAGLAVNDKEATDMLRRLAYGDQVLGAFSDPVKGGTVGVTGRGAERGLEDLLEQMPGQVPVSLRHAAKAYVGATKGTSLRNPLATRGVGGRTKSTFGPFASGEEVSHLVEGVNRLGPYIEGLKKNLDRRFLADKINSAQVNYGSRNFTQTEQTYAARLFPFYKFTKGITPFILKNLYERPGQAQGALIQGVSSASDVGPYTPDYIAETSAVPFPGAPEGNLRFLSNFGLSYEDPLSFLAPGALTEIGSRLNPLIKAPIELAVGESLYQKGPEGGRALEDLDPLMGRALSNLTDTLTGERTREAQPVGGVLGEQIASNSPIASPLFMARTLLDPRKRESPGAAMALISNLLTGMRVTDVSPASQEAVAREYTQSLLRDFPEVRRFTRPYIPEETKQEMDPLQRQQAESLLSILDLLARRAQERAEGR